MVIHSFFCALQDSSLLKHLCNNKSLFLQYDIKNNIYYEDQ